MELQRITYTFYEKPRSSRFTILEKSASAYQQKKASLCQEVVRRILNMSTDRTQEERNEVVENFCSKLEDSGYSRRQIKDIVESGLVGYSRRVSRQAGVRHRKGESTKKSRIKKKFTGKKNWFKWKRKDGEKTKVERKGSESRKGEKKECRKGGKKREKQPSSVLFVPRTKGGKLSTLLREKEKELSSGVSWIHSYYCICSLFPWACHLCQVYLPYYHQTYCLQSY